jgi:hypothetical protein
MSLALRAIAQAELEQVERVLALDVDEFHDPLTGSTSTGSSRNSRLDSWPCRRGLSGHESGLRLIAGGRDRPSQMDTPE